PIVWHASSRRVFFEPSHRNIALYNRFMPPLNKLMEEWWNRIEDPRKFDIYRQSIEAYHATLKPGDVSLIGLLCEGAVGLQTGDNGRFLGYLKGTPQADAIAVRQRDLSHA